MYAIGVLAMLLSPRAQRLGDIAGRTIVVRGSAVSRLADLTSGGDEFAGGLALAGGRPILFADAETATNRKAVVVRLENAYIFVDGFESASPAYW